MIARETSSEALVASARPTGRRFIGTFLAVVLPALAILVGFSIVQDPVRGDLTRVGGYSENRYGWTATHKRFVPPIVSATYDRPHDIVILGDSYSAYGHDQQTDPGAYWPNHVARLSGLSVVVINIHHMTVRQLLDHPVFRSAPPRAVVLEIVERYLIRNLAIEAARRTGEGFDGCPVPGPSPRVALGQPLAVEPVAWRRDRSMELNLARAVDVMWESAWRRFAGINRSDTYSLSLDRASMFSHAAADQLLIHEEEIREGDWPAPLIAASLCRLRAIQTAVEANGRTAFLFVAAPDKLTVYEQHFLDARYRDTSKLDAIYADPYVSQARLLGPMREAIRCGAVDLYLANDTHWGTPGHEIAARVTVDALARLGTERASAPPDEPGGRCEAAGARNPPG